MNGLKDSPVWGLKKSEIWEDVNLKTTCYGCPAGTCGMIARRVNGVVVSVEGDPDCPFSVGKLCAKGQAQVMMTYSKRRLTTPLKRTNPEKGIGVDPGWVEISYEEAIRISAEKLKECRETDPNGLVFANSDFTTLPWFLGALLVSFGSANHTSGGRAFCGTSVHPALQLVHGGFHAGPDFEHCNYVILFGSNKGAMTNWAAVTSTYEMALARARGMKVVVVDPWCSNGAAVADQWVPIRPGTDGALVLAMLNVLLNELQCYDEEFLRKLSNAPYLIKGDGHYLRDPEGGKPMLWDEHDQTAKTHDDPSLTKPAMEGRYTVNGEQVTPSFVIVKEHLRKYSPERAEEITSVPAKTIRQLATDFGKAASIGSTIEIDGHTLPLRPACAHWYKGVSQHTGGYEQGLAIAMLNSIVGAIDLPGGLLADTVYAHHPEFSENSIWMGRGSGMNEHDGMLTPGDFNTYGGAFPGPYPPKLSVEPYNHSADAMGPVAVHHSGLLAKMNVLEPKKFKDRIPHNPLVYIQCVSNDLLNEGNPKRQADYLRMFGFQLSIVPNLDETAEFADIVIPTQTQLERLDMGANNIPDTMGSTATGEYCIQLRQPVAHSEDKHFVDIWVDVAEKGGFLPDFNKSVNSFMDLHHGFELEPEGKYDYRELTQRWIGAMTAGKLTLEDVAKEGRIKWKKTVKERFPRAFYTARLPIYYEYFLQVGQMMKKLIDEMGLQKEWDLSRYVPLVDWHPGPGFGDASDGYELYGVNYKWPFMTATFSNFNPWLGELADNHPYAGKIVLNRKYAQSKGIKDGERIRVHNRRGRVVEGEAMLSECIHPECVGMDHHGGNWAKSVPPRRKNTGVQAGALFEYDMENLDVMGGSFEASPKLRVTRL